MRSNFAEFALLTLIVLVVAYLVVTPLARKTADSLNNSAQLFDKRN